MKKPTKGVDANELTVDQIRGIIVDNGAEPAVVDQFDEFVSRRRFFGLLGKGSAAAALVGIGAGSEAVLSGVFGRGMIPVAWAEEAAGEAPLTLEGKPGMNVYNLKPINGEYDAHMLDQDVTPIERHFVRNNGLVSERKDVQDWSLTIDGEVHTPLKLSFDELKKFEQVSLVAPIECGGNGRGYFEPAVRGNQWKNGAIGCSKWTGVRLRDVLKKAGLKDSAVYTGHYGEDPPIAGEAFSRGIPIDKAMEEHTIIAFAMNDEPIPALHGYPVRLVVPGWIGSCSQKWLNRIWVRDKEHDSSKMVKTAYRVPPYPVTPGEKGPDGGWLVATSWPIKSMITSPAANGAAKAGEKVTVRGSAWAGEEKVDKVMVSMDFGATWTKADLKKPANKYAWARFSTDVKFPSQGYYEVWAQAYDNKGRAQPFRQAWNPKGYMGNMVHRVPVMVSA